MKVKPLSVPPTAGDLIPDPALIRVRPARVRIEARLLARQLRVSEDYARALPARSADDGKDSAGG